MGKTILEIWAAMWQVFSFFVCLVIAVGSIWLVIMGFFVFLMWNVKQNENALRNPANPPAVYNPQN